MPDPRGANPLSGAIDMHVHAFPDVVPRSIHDLDLARRAAEAGMRGVVIKNHASLTGDRAFLVRQVVPGVEVFGGVALNYSVGAVNPAAVENMIKFTGGYGKIVWLPTFDSANHKSRFARRPDAGGIRVTDETGNAMPEVRRVFKLAAAADIIVATGHVSAREALACTKAAREEGVRKILITHALQSPVEMSLDDIRRCVEMGALIEHCFVSSLMGPQSPLDWMREWKNVAMDDFAAAIKAVGARNCILSTDLGQSLNPLPVDGLKEFIRELGKRGIGEEEIDVMAKKNPARLLGLEPM